MTDIPLSTAQVIWRAVDNPELPAVKVVSIPADDDRRYYASWGACNQDFNEASPEDKVNMLFRQFHQLVTFDGVDPAVAHEAFMPIPEYRRALADFGTLDPAKV